MSIVAKAVTIYGAKGLAKNILALRKINIVGASAAQIRATVVWLRDFKDTYESAWTALGLPNMPTIRARVHTLEPIPYGTTIIYFGGEEPPARGPMGAIIEGDEQVVAKPGLDYVTFGAEIPDMTMGPNPFELCDLSVPDFFNGVVLIHKGIRISRFDVIEFAAYELHCLHSYETSYQQRDATKISVLSELHGFAPFHIRDNLDYLLLSIARDFAKAPDLERFLSATS
jgi:hypothetical protein